jgi:prolipoprotein diacylglyceryltransferase
MAYVTGTIFVLLGIAILLNVFQMNQLPDQFKWIMGVVLLLYGFFRIVVTIFRKPPKNEKV